MFNEQHVRIWRHAILYAGLAAFVAYYSLYAFRSQWVGDIHVYLAVLHALYAKLWLPAHEAIATGPGHSIFYTPYMLLIGIAGQVLGVSPYRALQLAAVANLIIYAGAIVWFFRTFASNPKSPWPPLVFIAVSLFLRSENYTWSSETNHQTMRLIQAYPSFLGWSIALISFVLAERVIRGAHVRVSLVALTVLIAFIALTHGLTATWIVGIVGLRGLYAVATACTESIRNGLGISSPTVRKETKAASKIIAAIVAAAGLCLLWPYYSILLLGGMSGIPENSPYGGRPIQIMPAVYALGLLAAIAFVRRGKHHFWIVAFIATTAAWALFRLTGIQFGDRYVFFMAFFPQLLLADAAALAIARIWESPTLRSGWRVGAAAAYLVALGGAILLAPTMDWRDLVRGPLGLRHAPSSETAFYSRWSPFRAALKPGDVVMMSNGLDGMDIAAVTGARMVAVPFAVAVPDIRDRVASIERFFSVTTPLEARRSELNRWGANKIVLSGPTRALAPTMEALFGPPSWRDASALIYDASR